MINLGGCLPQAVLTEVESTSLATYGTEKILMCSSWKTLDSLGPAFLLILAFMILSSPFPWWSGGTPPLAFAFSNGTRWADGVQSRFVAAVLSRSFQVLHTPTPTPMEAGAVTSEPGHVLLVPLWAALGQFTMQSQGSLWMSQKEKCCLGLCCPWDTSWSFSCDRPPPPLPQTRHRAGLPVLHPFLTGLPQLLALQPWRTDWPERPEPDHQF